MTASTETSARRRGMPGQPALWGVAALLLLLPWVAMQFTDAVNWTGSDFAVFGAMLVVACGAYELAAWMTHVRAYRVVAGLVIAAVFLLVWAELAVGIFR